MQRRASKQPATSYKQQGFRYLTSDKVAHFSDEQFLERLRAIPTRGGKAARIEAQAILSGVTEPPVTVTRTLELYWQLAKATTVGKSPDQIRKWENPIKQAIRDFVAVVGDKPLADIVRDDVRAFRDWWLERLETEGLSPSTVNKNVDHFGKVLKLVNEEKGLNLTLPLGGLRLEEGEQNTRPPFSTEWIADRLLAPGALDGLHPEARAIFCIMINTGARPSDIATLTKPTIWLQANVPNISIEPIGRKLKTRNARRVIPLVGVSLEAAQNFPEGFPHYRNNPQLSKDVSDYLTAHDLRETPTHVLYGLRHSFEDRLLAAEVDERIRRDLMGHSLNRVRYGEGGSLGHLQRVIRKIAVDPP